ncbi:magnesium and cobalt transport protein CorA [Longivirga aurantiaca]|uniref:Magnesium and cobalt transport protein CorA n=1 Tax=Longivirga aurantiaca TaxID=1837743 RepID=A0ABW1T1E5_9ACTN
MIRGVGLYCDGTVRPDGVVPIEVGTTFDDDDARVLASLWLEAKEAGPDSFVWLGLRNVEHAELTRAADVLGLDELLVEDALSVTQRAKVEVDGDRVTAVFKILGYVEETSDVETGQIAVFVGPSFVLSVRMGEPGDLRDMRSRLEGDFELLQAGPLAVLHGILDVVVDGYISVAEELGVDIEQIEEQVFSPERTDDAATIYKLKRENLELRRAVEPLTPVADALVRGRLIPIPEVLGPYYRDLGDHLLRAADLSTQHDNLLGAALEASRSRQAVQQNEDMRKISAWVAIAAIPTAIAAIYGMNFDDMPELRWDLGYPAVMIVIFSGMFALYRAFKRSGWL